jgi:hypothetical protein
VFDPVRIVFFFFLVIYFYFENLGSGGFQVSIYFFNTFFIC